MRQTEEYKALKKQLNDIKKRMQEIEMSEFNKGILRITRYGDHYHLDIKRTMGNELKNYTCVIGCVNKSALIEWITKSMSDLNSIKEYLENIHEEV